MVARQYLNQFRYVTEESAENLMIYMISIRKGRGEVVLVFHSRRLPGPSLGPDNLH